MATPDHGHITTVMHDTTDLDGAVAFWAEILGLEVRFRNDRYVYLSHLSEQGPHLAFQLVPEEKTVKNRLHFDIRVDDRPAFEDRVIGLGGRKIGEVGEEGFPRWTVMADPQGNEFCIYEADDS